MNAIATESARSGTRDWRIVRPAAAREIEGYACAGTKARPCPAAQPVTRNVLRRFGAVT